MQNPTLIEVKCEYAIPFHSELTNYIQKLTDGRISENFNAEQVPHKEAVADAVKSRMLFIRSDFAGSIKKYDPKCSRPLRRY